VSLSGALRFGRYAFPPNALGYCGPDDSETLFQYVTEQKPDRGMVELERRFEGAYPYLCLIAQSNHIADPFDDRVVDAYWVGNSLLRGVGARAMHASMSERFQRRMDRDDFRWLVTKLDAARPHHNFHVFDIYVRTGLMRDDRAKVAIAAMDSCRISWGRVTAVESAELIVERPELILGEGRLKLSEPRVCRIERQRWLSCQ